MSAFAALVLLGVASSCKDQNFDWENAHALTSVEKFTDTFIKEFGQPAEGHKWGFDLPWKNPQVTRAAGDFDPSQPGVFKFESENAMKIILDYGYGAVPNITTREHFEVRQWFSTHKVTWEHTTRVVGNAGEGVLKDKNGNEVFVLVNDEHFCIKWTNNPGENGGTLVYLKDLDPLENGELYSYAGGKITFKPKGRDLETHYSDGKKYLGQGDKSIEYTGQKYLSVIVNNKEQYVFNSEHSYDKIIEGGSYVTKDGKTISGYDFVVDGSNAGSPFNKIVEIVRFKGQSTRGTNLSAVALASLHEDNSIRNYMSSDYWTEGLSVGVGTKILFKNAWLQEVAYDVDHNPVITGSSHEDDLKYPADITAQSWWGNTGNSHVNFHPQTGDDIRTHSTSNTDEKNTYGTPVDKGNSAGSKMNFLHVASSSGASTHSLDYNATGCWGYSRQTDKLRIQATGEEYYKNGQLICNSEINNIVYANSIDTDAGNNFHDKWILVYLKGEGYEGWYLGFDYEGYGPTVNSQVVGNGICDDLIIKLTDPSEKFRKPDCRIMCEDLGGLGNEVNTGARVLKSDIDYNDIVFDVEASEDGKEITLTLQAAGGTLPLTVWYGSTPLFETHEFFKSENNVICNSDGTVPASHTYLAESEYKIMYNTSKDQTDNLASATKKSLKLYFENATGSSGQYVNFGDKKFNLEDLVIKVYRHDVYDFIGNPRFDFSPAVWVDIQNVNGSAPLKLCVPLWIDNEKTKQVRWLLERVPIDEGYLDFKDWVASQKDYFWVEGKRIDSSKLY